MQVVLEVVKMALGHLRQPTDLRELEKFFREERKMLKQETGFNFNIVSCYLKQTIMRPGSGLTLHFDGQTTYVGMESWNARSKRRQLKVVSRRQTAHVLPLTKIAVG